ncbi:MAG: AAA family ATPase [Gammaproteobacteria bacterium]|nr:AAA family ATPase [Gammaproteobacteria bacterium]
MRANKYGIIPRLMPHIKNPYIAGNPVGHGAVFTGRAELVDAVLRALDDPEINAILLHGERRIGKTSLLQHLHDRLSAPTTSPPSQAQEKNTLFFDCQDKAAWSLGQIVRDLAQKIAAISAGGFSDLGDEAGDAPEEVFRSSWLPRVLQQRPLVLLFDELDVLAMSEAEPADFFSYLRQLLNTKRLKAVFVIGCLPSELPLNALALFENLPEMRVSLLNREETAQLVRLSDSIGLRWTEEAVARVWHYTRGHPLLTQQLCFHVWEERTLDISPGGGQTLDVWAEDVNAVVREVLRDCANVLEWWWYSLSPGERIVASLAATHKKPVSEQVLAQALRAQKIPLIIRELQNALRLLAERDVFGREEDGCFRFCVELQRRWVAEDKILSRVLQTLERESTVEGLYQAAHYLCRRGESDQAIAPLQKVVDLAPRHIPATLLLADALLAQGRLADARAVLERLYKVQPGTAVRVRLVQVWLRFAKQTADEQRLLTVYAQVLVLEPQQKDAEAGRKDILRRRGEAALLAQDFSSALAAFQEAGLEQRAAEAEQAMAAQRQEREKHLADLYRRALTARKNGDLETAQTLFIEVLYLAPDYKKAILYLARAIQRMKSVMERKGVGPPEKALRQRIQEAGEIRAGVQAWVLEEFVNAGLYWGGVLNDYEEAQRIFLNGIKHAEHFLNAGETHPGVREQMLSLYFGAGLNVGQSLNNHEEEQRLYLKGIELAERFLEAGETHAGVREQALNLYINAGTNVGASLNKREEAQWLSLKGIEYAKLFLEAGETHAGVREQVVWLYANAGRNLGKQNKHKEVQQLCLKGIGIAERFLKAGETQAEMHKQVLNLYDLNSSVLYNQGRIDMSLIFFPLETYLLWRMASEQPPEDWKTQLNNFRIGFPHIVFPARLTTLFESFIHTLLLHWHAPGRTHRHLTAIHTQNASFTPTDALFRLGEGLYLLEQARDKWQLNEAWVHLMLANDPRMIAEWQSDISRPFDELLKKMQTQWRALLPDISLPTVSFGFVGQCHKHLDALPWWKRWFRKRALDDLRTALQQGKGLLEADYKLKQEKRWEVNIHNAQEALGNWLLHGLLKLLARHYGEQDLLAENDRTENEISPEKIPSSFSMGETENHPGLADGLSDPAAILLGVLLAYSGEDAEAAVAEWQKRPLWEDSALCEEAVRRSQLLIWASHGGAAWHNLQTGTMRSCLHFAKNTLNQPHEELSEALTKWQERDNSVFIRYLNAAWASARQQAQPLARLLTALEDKEFARPLDQAVEKGETTAATEQRALAAVILGTGRQALEQSIAGHLQQQGTVNCFSIPVACANLQGRFNQVLKIYPSLSQNDVSPEKSKKEALHAWAEARMRELSAAKKPDAAALWAALERVRVALAGSLTIALGQAWEEKTGEALHQAFAETLSILIKGPPDPQQTWPPLAAWLPGWRAWTR